VLEPETRVVEALGNDRLESLRCRTKGESVVPASSLFVFIGAERCGWLPPAVLRDANGLCWPVRTCGLRKLPESWKERASLSAGVQRAGRLVAGDVRPAL